MKFRSVLLTAILFTACNTAPERTTPDNATASKDIFPVASFIQGEVHLVDSLKPPIVRFSTNKNMLDTAVIDQSDFQKLATEFTDTDISQSNCNDCYEENNFNDQSVGGVTLTYTALKKDLPVRRLDVIVHPAADGTDKVKSIYIEKIVNQEDSSVHSKLFWKAGKYFQIITNTIKGKEAAQARQVKVVWDPTDS